MEERDQGGLIITGVRRNNTVGVVGDDLPGVFQGSVRSADPTLRFAELTPLASRLVGVRPLRAWMVEIFHADNRGNFRAMPPKASRLVGVRPLRAWMVDIFHAHNRGNVRAFDVFGVMVRWNSYYLACR